MTNAVALSKTAREDSIGNPITLHPGEKAQFLHRDMDNYPVFRRYGVEHAPELTAPHV